MSNFRAEYCPNGCNGKEFGKPGMPLNTSVNATPLNPTLWVKEEKGTGNVVEILTVSTMASALNVEYGAPAEVWLRISDGGVDTVNITLTLINKTTTRFSEAAFLTFAPIQTVVSASNPGSGWAMDKLGEWVSPLAVADGGSQGMSPINTGMLYARGGGDSKSDAATTGGGGGGAAFFRTFDSAVVKFGEKIPFPTPIHGGPDMSAGIHYLLWDNYWNTNYVFWW
jgi:hypothetical protein